MLMDANSSQLRAAMATGIFSGRVLRFVRDGQIAVVQGLTGPSRVLISAVLFKHRRPAAGDEVSYVAMLKPGVRDIAVGVRIIRTRSMP